MSYPEESLYWKGRGMDSSQSEPSVSSNGQGEAAGTEPLFEAQLREALADPEWRAKWAGRASPASVWRTIDAPPPAAEWALFWNPDWLHPIVCKSTGGKTVWIHKNGCVHMASATHWMPLPEPPAALQETKP